MAFEMRENSTGSARALHARLSLIRTCPTRQTVLCPSQLLVLSAQLTAPRRSASWILVNADTRQLQARNHVASAALPCNKLADVGSELELSS